MSDWLNALEPAERNKLKSDYARLRAENHIAASLGFTAMPATLDNWLDTLTVERRIQVLADPVALARQCYHALYCVSQKRETPPPGVETKPEAPLFADRPHLTLEIVRHFNTAAIRALIDTYFDTHTLCGHCCEVEQLVWDQRGLVIHLNRLQADGSVDAGYDFTQQLESDADFDTFCHTLTTQAGLSHAGVPEWYYRT